MRSVTESEWDDQQQGWMLALQMYRDSLCPGGCGQKLDDCTAMEGTHEWRTRKVRCHACDALRSAQNAYQRPNPDAVLWLVEKR